MKSEAITDLNPNTIIQRNEAKFLANSLGDETVMMDMDSGDYIGINNVGSDIWNLLSEPMTVQALMDKILDMYDVTQEQCANEVNTFLSKMQEHDMLIIKTA